MTHAASNSLVILLHGVGSNGADMARLAQAWIPALPDVDFAAPDAPNGSDFGSGFQWFSVSGVTDENRAGRIEAARDGFDRTISAIMEKHGFADRLDRVAFAGFSQGTIMALDAIISGRWPVAAVVGFSGRLASPMPYKASLSTRTLLIHGTADGVIPSTETTKAAAVLGENGLSVEAVLLEGVGHTINGEGAARGAAFLKSIFQG